MIQRPAVPNPEFVGKTGNGDRADCLAEADYRTGQILDAIEELALSIGCGKNKKEAAKGAAVDAP